MRLSSRDVGAAAVGAGVAGAVIGLWEALRKNKKTIQRKPPLTVSKSKPDLLDLRYEVFSFLKCPDQKSMFNATSDILMRALLDAPEDMKAYLAQALATVYKLRLRMFKARTWFYKDIPQSEAEDGVLLKQGCIMLFDVLHTLGGTDLQLRSTKGLYVSMLEDSIIRREEKEYVVRPPLNKEEMLCVRSV